MVTAAENDGVDGEFDGIEKKLTKGEKIIPFYSKLKSGKVIERYRLLLTVIRQITTESNRG